MERIEQQMKSNIVAGSNVYLSRTDDPMQDPAFVSQIQDYPKLKEIAAKRLVNYRLARFSKVQEEILKTELRCVYAKNDPCWGYREDLKRVVSACINGKCPNIRKCNPSYTAGDAAYWVTSDQEKELYGRPNKQRVYYFVDMISDEEMGQYISNPVNEGFKYPTPRNPVLVNEQDIIRKEEQVRIDPKTGRKMVVVGYRWIITDNASYESEELTPIWDFVNEVQVIRQGQTVQRKKAKRIEKKQESATLSVPQIKKPDEEDSDYARKEEYEQSVSRHITAEIKLTDLDGRLFDGSETVILLANPAELNFVSSTFLVSGIEHGIINDRSIMLALIDDYPKFAGKKHVMISNTAEKTGCQKNNAYAWKKLAETSSITLLRIAARDYYAFSYGDQKERWTCRNMYGVTHVCIIQDDIERIDVKQDGLYPVSLAENGNLYRILGKEGIILGQLGDGFTDMIRALKNAEEIPGLPSIIRGIALRIQNGKPEILGMGHLKFIEY